MTARVNLLSAADVALLLAPSHADRSGLVKAKSVGGTPSFTQSTAAYRGGYRSMTNIPDYAEWEEVLTAGTYTLAVEVLNASSGGAANITIDGAQTQLVDTYAASSAAARVEFASLVIAATGKHLIRFTVTTKNASSSSTTVRLSGYSLTRTGA